METGAHDIPRDGGPNRKEAARYRKMVFRVLAAAEYARVKGLFEKSRVGNRSGESIATAMIEVDKGYDTRELLDAVRANINVISTFPADAEKPVIKEIRIRTLGRKYTGRELAAGVAFATILTLVLVPSLFVILNDFRLLFHRVRRGPLRIDVEPRRRGVPDLEPAAMS